MKVSEGNTTWTNNSVRGNINMTFDTTKNRSLESKNRLKGCSLLYSLKEKHFLLPSHLLSVKKNSRPIESKYKNRDAGNGKTTDKWVNMSYPVSCLLFQTIFSSSWGDYRTRCRFEWRTHAENADTLLLLCPSTSCKKAYNMETTRRRSRLKKSR